MNIQNQRKKNATIMSIYNIILPSLSTNIREVIKRVDPGYLNAVEEIRIRENRPLMITLNNRDYLLKVDGNITSSINDAYFVNRQDTLNILQLISDYSIYAIEEELRNGYITLKGGHRVGFTGKGVLEDGEIKTLKYISGFNFRISREIKGAANIVIPYIKDRGEILHTLIISPPQCGKTTLLRDLIRQISNGDINKGLRGYKVGVVDERSELAGCFKGVPQNEIGIRTDVLDACPKAKGMIMLIRSMSPRIIATDEIGSKEDMLAIEEALNAGIKIITTVHGSSIEEVSRKPVLRDLINNKVFERLIILSSRKGAGTIEKIINGKTLKNIFN
jgi:stage III sporulation protein AA